MEKYHAVRGMHDVMPAEVGRWQRVEREAGGILHAFGFSEVRTPVVEESRLFERSVGEATDIVEKEMYRFPDRKGRMLALRPEGTASVVRAYLEAGLPQAEKVSRLYYYGPMFRYDRPQKGRYRQFFQLGVELLGGADPFFDGEVIALLHRILAAVLPGELHFVLNSIGCRDCQKRYAEQLQKHFAGHAGLCGDCLRRIGQNPLRVLDCKVQTCRDLMKTAPCVAETLCPDCRAHFDGVRRFCDTAAIPVTVDYALVRGLDYYTRTVFEVNAPGVEGAVAAGGRYDGLVADLGGPAIPAVGWAVGLERLVELMGPVVPDRPVLAAFFLGAQAREHGVQLVARLRAAGLAVRPDYEPRSLKKYLEIAGREGIKRCLILGDNELAAGVVVVKDMAAGEQKSVAEENLISEIKGRSTC